LLKDVKGSLPCLISRKYTCLKFVTEGVSLSEFAPDFERSAEILLVLPDNFLNWGVVCLYNPKDFSKTK